MLNQPGSHMACLALDALSRIWTVEEFRVGCFKPQTVQWMINVVADSAELSAVV